MFNGIVLLRPCMSPFMTAVYVSCIEETFVFFKITFFIQSSFITCFFLKSSIEFKNMQYFKYILDKIYHVYYKLGLFLDVGGV
jgi:hypothetical protein